MVKVPLRNPNAAAAASPHATRRSPCATRAPMTAPPPYEPPIASTKTCSAPSPVARSWVGSNSVVEVQTTCSAQSAKVRVASTPACEVRARGTKETSPSITARTRRARGRSTRLSIGATAKATGSSMAAMSSAIAAGTIGGVSSGVAPSQPSAPWIGCRYTPSAAPRREAAAAPRRSIATAARRSGGGASSEPAEMEAGMPCGIRVLWMSIGSSWAALSPPLIAAACRSAACVRATWPRRSSPRGDSGSRSSSTGASRSSGSAALAPGSHRQPAGPPESRLAASSRWRREAAGITAAVR
mmetsp:Transcript_8345/g.26857  ORF Transcript_8345/g.26857 Transcript_8345/m.26857 type:complete len:299 (-) Transcript_8345:169-1065(-)